MQKEFTDVGELEELQDGSLVVRLVYGKILKRLVKHLYGKRLEVSFKPLKLQRSLSQNRWLWGVAYITIKAWYKETNGVSVSKDAIHAHTLQYILDYKPVMANIDGLEVIYMDGKSTSKLTVKEFNDLKTKLQAYWAERGCIIPDPKGNNFLSEFVKDE